MSEHQFDQGDHPFIEQMAEVLAVHELHLIGGRALPELGAEELRRAG